MSAPSATPTPKILAVVVLYKTALETSQTIAGLTIGMQDPELAREIGVLLWDNSPQPLPDPKLPFAFEYGWKQQNLGTAGAYNAVRPTAEARGIPWMLLLDHDTDVTPEYLRGMVRYAHELESQEEIGCVVPFVRSHGNLVSPRRFRPFNRTVAVERSFHGLLRDYSYAVNSASLMRVSTMREFGGYSEDFWLDLADVYAFEQLYRHGKVLFVAGDLELTHDVGGLNFEQSMVPERYETFLASESAYLQLYRPAFENWFHTFWLVLRAARQYIQYQNKRYAELTWMYFVQRVTTRPRKRMAIWMEYLRSRRSIPPVERKAQA